MTEKPSNIWTCNETNNIWISEPQEDTEEYIRADLVTMQKPPVDLIESYLARSSIGESYFGAKTCGNSNFVKRMREGGSFAPETIARVRAFIANNPAP